MLALGETMKVTGVSGEIASLVGRVGMGLADPAWSAFAVLIVLYLITAFLTEVLSNNATIVIMAPIALELGALDRCLQRLGGIGSHGPVGQGFGARFLCCGFRQFHNPDRLSDEYFRLHGGRLSVQGFYENRHFLQLDLFCGYGADGFPHLGPDSLRHFRINKSYGKITL